MTQYPCSWAYDHLDYLFYAEPVHTLTRKADAGIGGNRPDLREEIVEEMDRGRLLRRGTRFKAQDDHGQGCQVSSEVAMNRCCYLEQANPDFPINRVVLLNSVHSETMSWTTCR